jgi:hypothetical protein
METGESVNGKVIIRERKVVDISYATTDGEEFKTIEEASFHQEVLDGTKKICVDCNGEGYTVRMEERTDPDYPSGLPDSGWVTAILPIKYECNTCSGKGHLVLGWY